MEISDERPAKIRKLDGESNDAPPDLQGLKNISEPHLDQESTSPVNSASSQNDNRPEEDFTPSGANLSEHPDTADLSGALSKSQLKKLKKKQQWEEGREFRKVKRRETNARRKAKKAAEREAAGAETPGEAAPRASRRSKQLPIALVLDCDFDNLMTDKEIMSLGSQLTRCYSDNKNSPYRSHLMISSFGGQLKDRFEGILASTHLGWRGVRFTEKDFISAAEQAHVTMYGLEGGELAGALAQDFLDKDQQVGMLDSKDALIEEHRVEIDSSKGDEVLPSGNGIQAGEQQKVAITHAQELDTRSQPTNDSPQLTNEVSPILGPPTPSIIYLSSDSPHTLERLAPYTSYIIGGLVDKNRHKGICYKKACELGIPTAKLPIGEYMDMQSRTVLTTNHVIEIMVRWLELGDWGEAFLRVIPKRKEAKLKDKGKNGKRTIDGEEDGNDHHDHDVEGLLEDKSGGDHDSQNGEDLNVNTNDEDS